MHEVTLFKPGPYDDDANSILEQYDGYIKGLARKVFPRWLFANDGVDLEIDDLIQEIRIKFWNAWCDRKIVHPKAYLSMIVRNAACDIKRRPHRTVPLSLDESGELHQGAPLAEPGEGMRDPAYEYEYNDITADDVASVTAVLLTLPPLQQRAVLCSMKEMLGDVRPFVKSLQAHNIDIQAMHWPTRRRDAFRLKASLSPARKKLRALLKVAMPVY